MKISGRLWKYLSITETSQKLFQLWNGLKISWLSSLPKGLRPVFCRLFMNYIPEKPQKLNTLHAKIYNSEHHIALCEMDLDVTPPPLKWDKDLKYQKGIKSKAPETSKKWVIKVTQE